HAERLPKVRHGSVAPGPGIRTRRTAFRFQKRRPAQAILTSFFFCRVSRWLAAPPCRFYRFLTALGARLSGCHAFAAFGFDGMPRHDTAKACEPATDCIQPSMLGNTSTVNDVGLGRCSCFRGVNRGHLSAAQDPRKHGTRRLPK